MSGNDLIDPSLAVGYQFPEIETRFTERDVLVYALGVGAGADPADLRFVYENATGFAPLPTFAVVGALNVVLEHELSGGKTPGLNFGLDRVLHASQYTEIKKRWPSKGTLRHTLRIKDIWDKTKYAIVVSEVRTVDEAGDELAYNEFVMSVRGAGGWGGSPGPSGDVNTPPDRKADAVTEQKIREDQAILYRLSGDTNPLHIDPEFAAAFGLARPILHGLCTYGFAGRHVLRAFGKDDPRTVKSVRVKFSGPVNPGETLVTEMWRDSDTKVVFRASVKERPGKSVLANAAVEFVPGTL